jgi:hypothetical protein
MAPSSAANAGKAVTVSMALASNTFFISVRFLLLVHPVALMPNKSISLNAYPTNGRAVDYLTVH